jgi:hypothetical protein
MRDRPPSLQLASAAQKGACGPEEGTEAQRQSRVNELRTMCATTARMEHSPHSRSPQQLENPLKKNTKNIVADVRKDQADKTHSAKQMKPWENGCHSGDLSNIVTDHLLKACPKKVLN